MSTISQAGEGTPAAGTSLVLWTIGHSSRSIDEFIALLLPLRLELLADVRRHPGSRAHPQYNPPALAASLAHQGVDYLPFPELGGRRRPSPESHNTNWRNPSFRAYADYMETAPFRAGLERLIRAATERRTAMMCAEALWWRCHRALVADALKLRGARVLHIMDRGKVVEHPYTSAARVVDGRLRYGPAES